MHAEDLILVTGATGNTGAALLQQLEGRDARVRVATRASAPRTTHEPSSERDLRTVDRTLAAFGSLRHIRRVHIACVRRPDARDLHEHS